MKAVLMIFFILTMNVSFFLADQGMQSVQADIDNTKSPNSLFDKDASMMADFDKGNYTLSDPILPDDVDAESVSSDSEGNFFTDTWKTLKNGFSSVSQLGWVLKMANSIPSFLSKIGLPLAFVWAIGFLWHGLFIFLLVLVLTGRGS